MNNCTGTDIHPYHETNYILECYTHEEEKYLKARNYENSTKNIRH